MTSCGEAIVTHLKAQGIDTIFGIPGVHTVEFYRHLAAGGLRHVTPRHEQGAALMAYGYALASGRPAAVSVITGAGLTNAVTGIGQAFSDSVPMLVISAGNQLAEINMAGGRLHELPTQDRVEQAVSGYAHLLLDPDNIDAVMARAAALFAAKRPRPAVIQVPRDLFARPLANPPKAWAAPSRPAPAAGAIEAAVAMLADARDVVLILGGGARAATAQATRLAERLGALVITTIAGKGIVPAGHPLSLGATLPYEPIQQAIVEADLVLAVGTELAETDSWVESGGLTLNGKLVRIDIDPDQLATNLRPDVAIFSDAGLALDALLAALDETEASSSAVERAGRLRATLDAMVWPEEPLAHRLVLDAIREAVPEDTFISVDSTQLAYTGSRYYPASLPGCWHFPNGYGTLGTGLPAAIGAKIARPERPVMALAGDGGFLFTIQELAVAAREKLGIPILLWNSESYEEIRQSMIRRQVPPLGTDIQAPDFQAVVSGFGCDAERIDGIEALRRGLRAAFDKDRPTVLEIRTDADFLK